MQNLFKDLEQLLLQCDDYSIDGKLNKPKIEEQALSLAPQLLKILLSHAGLKKHFFQDIDSVLVFDKVKFQKFIANKQFLPDSYTQFKNKIGLTANGAYLTESKEVVLDFPYKDCVLQGCQDKEDSKRNEVFFNETLAPDDIDMLLEPKALTNFKKYDATGEHKVTELNIQDNLIIKGNNLLALHSLLSVYRGKVKLIYIDPPYNTGNDSFGYNDKFNHSTWLTFMKNRLEVARELLRDDGVIFVQCDDNEQAYLKVLMDGVFRSGNFITTVSVTTDARTRSYEALSKTHEFILIYAKTTEYELYQSTNEDKEFQYTDSDGGFDLYELRNRNSSFNIGNRPNLFYPFYLNPNSKDKNDLYELSLEPKEGWVEVIPQKSGDIQTVWRQSKETADTKLNTIIFGKAARNGYQIVKKYREITSSLSSVWNDKCFLSDRGTLEIKALFDNKKIFSFPKPEYLISRIIEISTQANDIVLDYHLGSGTTAAVAHKMSRQYIGIEQMDYIEDISVTRLKKVIGKVDETKDLLEPETKYKDFDSSGISKALNWQGGGNFVYCELKQNNQLWVDKVINAVDNDELLNIWQIMQDKAQLSYKIDVKTINNSVNDFKLLSLDEQKKFLLEIIDKNQLYVNYTEIDDVDYQCTEEEKNLNNIFYGLK